MNITGKKNTNTLGLNILGKATRHLAAFLKNEDGFLGALFGTAVGSLIGGGSGNALAKMAGGLIGKNFDERRAVGKEREYQNGALQRTVDQAKAAGIHPLEAIRSGYANAQSAGPRVGTTAAFTDTFDQIDSVLSGREAQKDRLRESQIRLNRIEADSMARGAGSNGFAGGRLASSTIRGTGTHDRDVIERPASQTEFNINTNVSDEDLDLSDPNRGDASLEVERQGESEVYQEVQFFTNKFINDPRYNSMVTDFAEMLNKSRKEVHEQIKKGGQPEFDRLKDEWLKNGPMQSHFWQDQNVPVQPRLTNPMLSGSKSPFQ